MEKSEIVAIIKNGGATLDKHGEAITFNRGYQVSKKDCFILSVKNVDKITEAVNEILRRIAHEEGSYCGLWVDNGKIYADISELIKSEKKAVKIGKARKQISVYDWKNAACLYL